MVDQALARSRDGNIFARTLARAHRRARWTPTSSPRVQLLRRGRHPPARQGPQGRRPHAERRRGRVLRRRRQHACPAATGCAVQASELHREIRAAIVVADADRAFVAQTRHVKPKVTTDELERKYGTVLIVNRRRFRLALYKDLKLAQDLPDRRRQGRPRDAGRPLHDPEQGDQPRLARARQRLGRASCAARSSRAATPEQPDQGALAGRSTTAPASTAPIRRRARSGTHASHGCVRMHIPDVEELYDQVPVGAADLHRLRAEPAATRRGDLVDRDLLPAALAAGRHGGR